VVRGAGKLPRRRVRGGAAVIEPGAREVTNPPAARGVAPLPILLLAATDDRLVEHSDLLERAGPDRHVGAPHERHVAVLRTAVERRDRRLLAAAGAWPTALEPGPNRTAEDVVAGRRAHAVEDRLEPPWRDFDIIIDEH